VSNLIVLSDVRRQRKVRGKLCTIDTSSLRCRIKPTGAMAIVADVFAGGVWSECTWDVDPELAARIGEMFKGPDVERPMGPPAVGEVPPTVDPAPAQPPGRAWKKCKLTPEGYLGPSGCRRRRGHAGLHDNGKKKFTLECPHFGMFITMGISRIPREPTCPWCHIILEPQEPRA